ncbi:hypothetical protein Rsub_06928 [Raphidocelis subcapitata]|uniref:RING-type domain-containing protein n=1 Tax=Raphidocelis subcapitata TaxID=307507 RepID=A0A2V0P370_9CHLO|nr:hypothetical protein Rsub_06928 [Raphidocelis subcapitata]|eukprot:GBF94306.1 hypothetical protein Rsub_06928 [Raphidocelis subcapitata]
MDCVGCFGSGPNSRKVLQAAAHGGEAAAATVRQCIAQRPKLAVANDWGWHTAWHRAAEHGHAEVIEAMAAALLEGDDGGGDGGGGGGAAVGQKERLELLRRGIDSRDDCGLTPLMVACVYKHAPCVRALVRLGANCLQLDYLGRGAQHYAALALASYEPCLSIQNTDSEPLILGGIGNTPLHLAAFKGSFDMVKALLGIHMQNMSAGTDAIQGSRQQWGQQYTADIRHIRNRRGLMPYHVALVRHGDRLSELLHPDVPYTYIFNNADMQSGAVRMYGPAKLCVLAAGALQRKLLDELDAVAAAAEAAAAAAGVPLTAAEDGGSAPGGGSGGGGGGPSGGSDEGSRPGGGSEGASPKGGEWCPAGVCGASDSSNSGSGRAGGSAGAAWRGQAGRAAFAPPASAFAAAANGAPGFGGSERSWTAASTAAAATAAAPSGPPPPPPPLQAPSNGAAGSGPARRPPAARSSSKRLSFATPRGSGGGGGGAGAAPAAGAAAGRGGRGAEELQAAVSGMLAGRRGGGGSSSFLGSFVGRRSRPPPPPPLAPAPAPAPAGQGSPTGGGGGDVSGGAEDAEGPAGDHEPLPGDGLDAVLSWRSGDLGEAQRAYRLMVLASGLSQMSEAGGSRSVLLRAPSGRGRSYSTLSPCPSAATGLARLGAGDAASEAAGAAAEAPLQRRGSRLGIYRRASGTLGQAAPPAAAQPEAGGGGDDGGGGGGDDEGAAEAAGATAGAQAPPPPAPQQQQQQQPQRGVRPSLGGRPTLGALPEAASAGGGDGATGAFPAAAGAAVAAAASEAAPEAAPAAAAPPSVEAKWAASMPAAQSGSLEGGSWDDEDESTCEICYDAVCCVKALDCGHKVCISCGHELCQLHHFRPALCPFCRQIIRGYAFSHAALAPRRG